MPFKETRHSDGVTDGAVAICCYDCECTQQHNDVMWVE